MRKLPESTTLLLSSLDDFELPHAIDIRTRSAIISADRVHFTPSSSGDSTLETFVGNTRVMHISAQRASTGDHPQVHTRQIADMFSVPHAVTSLSIGSYLLGAQSLVVLLNSFPSLTHLAFPETQNAVLWGGNRGKFPVFDALGTPRDTDGAYPCPNLCSLKIFWTYLPLPRRSS